MIFTLSLFSLTLYASLHLFVTLLYLYKNSLFYTCIFFYIIIISMFLFTQFSTCLYFDVIILVLLFQYFFLHNLLYIFVSMSLFQCFFLCNLLYIFILMSLFQYLFLWQSFTHFHLDCFFHGDSFYIFLLVFLWYFLGCFHLGVFYVCNLLHLFISMFSAIKLSQITLSGCFLLQQSPTYLCFGVFCYKDLLYVFYKYLAKGDQLF